MSSFGIADEDKRGVLGHGVSFHAKYGKPAEEQVRRERSKAAAEEEGEVRTPYQRFAAGELAFDRVPAGFTGNLLRSVDRATLSDSRNVARRLLGRGLERRDPTSDPAFRGLFSDRQGRRALAALEEAADAREFGYTPAGANQIVGRRQLDEALQARARAGSAYRRKTGFGVGPEVDGRVALFDDDDRLLAKIPQATARMLADDARFGPALKAFGAGVSKATIEDASALLAPAIEAASSGALVTDSLVFEDNAERLRIAEGNLRTLRSARDPEAKRFARQTLFTTLFAEALPHKQSLQFLLDILPGTGNLNAAEAAWGSFNAAVAAYEAGDAGEASAQTAATLLNLLGAVGGVGGSALATRAGRNAVGRSARNAKARIHEAARAHKLAGEYGDRGRPSGPQPKTWSEIQEFARQDAAMKRAEEWINRPAGKQLLDDEKRRLKRILDQYDPGIHGSLRDLVTKSIGDAGEFAFEPVLQRWHPGSLSEVRLKQVKKALGPNPSQSDLNAFNRMKDALKTEYFGSVLHHDAIVKDALVIRNGDRVELVNRSGANVGIDAKTGRSSADQKLRRKVHRGDAHPSVLNAQRGQAQLRTVDNLPSAPLQGAEELHVVMDEWAPHFRKAFKARVSNATADPKNSISPEILEQYMAEVFRAMEIPEFRELLRDALLEYLAVATLRALPE